MEAAIAPLHVAHRQTRAVVTWWSQNTGYGCDCGVRCHLWGLVCTYLATQFVPTDGVAPFEGLLWSLCSAIGVSFLVWGVFLQCQQCKIACGNHFSISGSVSMVCVQPL